MAKKPKAVEYEAWHETNVPFGRFDAAKSGTSTQVKGTKDAVFFAMQRENAMGYGHAAKTAVTRNQLRELDRQPFGSDYNARRDAIMAKNDPRAPVYLMKAKVKLTNPFVIDNTHTNYSKRTDMEALFSPLPHDDIARARAAGHDGVVFKNTPDGSKRGDWVVAFKSENAKIKEIYALPGEQYKNGQRIYKDANAVFAAGTPIKVPSAKPIGAGLKTPKAVGKLGLAIAVGGAVASLIQRPTAVQAATPSAALRTKPYVDTTGRRFDNGRLITRKAG